jgi:putative transposase
MENTMADELRIGLAELLRKTQMEHDVDFLKEGVRALSQALMEMEVDKHIGASRHERTEGRSGHRNGYRERTWNTRAGAIELMVPRVRDGSYFPSLLVAVGDNPERLKSEASFALFNSVAPVPAS